MKTKQIGHRVATMGLITMLVPLGAVLAGTAPPVDPPTPPPVRSVDRSTLAPGPLAKSNAEVPWVYENLVAYPPARSCPLRPLNDGQPEEPTTKEQPALGEVQPPGIVQNLRRADRP